MSKYKGNIKFKVVGADDRESAYAEDEYKCCYTKDTIVTAPPNTAGLMTFKTRRNAEAFIWGCGLRYSREALIIRVKCFGRGKMLKQMCRRQTTSEIRFFYEEADLNSLFKDSHLTIYPDAVTRPPIGTICYQKVEVLD